MKIDIFKIKTLRGQRKTFYTVTQTENGEVKLHLTFNNLELAKKIHSLQPNLTFKVHNVYNETSIEYFESQVTDTKIHLLKLVKKYEQNT